MLCNLVTSDLLCVSSVVVYTLVLNTPYFYWCGACRGVLLLVQWCSGGVVHKLFKLALSYGLVFGVVTQVALSVKIGHKSQSL